MFGYLESDRILLAVREMFPEAAGAWINIRNRFPGTSAWKSKCLNRLNGGVVRFQSVALIKDLEIPL
jgi:hypothetical protein